MDKKRFSYIVILHCIGVLMILFCHFAQEMKNNIIGELLASGVPLFLFISGYLTGLKTTSISYKWLKRKGIRILVPYYVVLITVFITFIIIESKEVHPLQWIVLTFNFQGLTNYIVFNDTVGYYSPLNQGLGHFWYVSVIMVCYVIIIIFSRIYDMSKTLRENNKLRIILLCLTVFLLQPVLLFYNVHINYLVIFILGWLYARNELVLTVKKYSFITSLMFAGVLLRLLAKEYIDGTLIYDKYIVTISSDIIGIWIFISMIYVYKLYPEIIDRLAHFKAVIFLESIIYEFYLIHHIVTKGSWSLFKVFDNFYVAMLVIIVITIVLSVILKHIVNIISQFIEK